MIINQDVEVSLTSNNVEHFKNKGFEPTYYIDKEKKKRLKREIIIVNVFDLPKGSKVEVSVKCDNCGNEFTKPYGFALKNKRHYCCIECQSEHKSKIQLDKLEDKIGEPLYDYLYREYVTNKKTFRQISECIYGNPKNNSSVGYWLKKLNIPIRHGSEAIKTQWINNEQRRKKHSELMKKASPTFDRSFMHTDEYKHKQSEAKKGSKNGMWRVCGEKHPNWDKNRTHEKRQIERKSTKDHIWRSTIFSRDNRTCCKCGENKDKKMVVHHINSYDIHKEQRYDINNGIVMCEKCHKDFHSKYGYGKNTKSQFDEYLKAD